MLREEDYFGVNRATRRSACRPVPGLGPLQRVPVVLTHRSTPGVTRGLDPRVHPPSQEHLAKMMDCRVKPGNDRSGSVRPGHALVTAKRQELRSFSGAPCGPARWHAA